MKNKLTPLQFCSENNTPYLSEILEELYLEDGEPNYDKLTFLLKKILLENGVDPSRGYSWDMKCNLQSENNSNYQEFTEEENGLMNQV